jgi:hypothetical protein
VVNEHRIRLRGGWECQSGCSGEVPERITLPIQWDPEIRRRVRLYRRFGRPAIDQDRQCLLLELDRARGIHSLLLNGKTVTAISPAKSYYLIPLAEIEERNELVLEIEIGETRDEQAPSERDWGQIALVIRPIESTRAP